MKTVLVTGGAGFLGSHLVDKLVHRGDSVVVVDNLATGQLANIEPALMSGRVTFIFGDVGQSSKDLRALLRDGNIGWIDEIYDFASAGCAKAPGARRFDAPEAEFFGTSALIAIALDHQAKFIFSSALSIDSRLHVEQTPDAPSDSPLERTDSSDEVDWRGEAVVLEAVTNRNLNARIVRFYNCYGPRMRQHSRHLVPALFEAITERRPLPLRGTSHEARSMLYVADAVKLLLLIANRRESAVAPINIGSDDTSTVDDIANFLSRRIGLDAGKTFVLERDAQIARTPDFTLAQALGWAPETPIERGLRMTFDWFALQGRHFI